MASESKASTVAAPVDGAQSVSTPDVCYQRVAPIQILLAIVRCFDLYQNALNKCACVVDTPEAQSVVAKINKNSDSAESYLERLKTIEALLVLLGIYVMSPFVTEADRAEIDMPFAPSRSRDEAPTRGAITATLHHVLGQDSTSEACRIKTSRIIEAAILFGLAESTKEGRANYKPLQGTGRLDVLMTQAGFEAALLLDKAIGNKG